MYLPGARLQGLHGGNQGTPCDCVLLAVNRLITPLPDQVLLGSTEHLGRGLICADDAVLAVQKHHHVGYGVKCILPVVLCLNQRIVRLNLFRYVPRNLDNHGDFAIFTSKRDTEDIPIRFICSLTGWMIQSPPLCLS